MWGEIGVTLKVDKILLYRYFSNDNLTGYMYLGESVSGPLKNQNVFSKCIFRNNISEFSSSNFKRELNR